MPQYPIAYLPADTYALVGPAILWQQYCDNFCVTLPTAPPSPVLSLLQLHTWYLSVAHYAKMMMTSKTTLYIIVDISCHRTDYHHSLPHAPRVRMHFG